MCRLRFYPQKNFFIKSSRDVIDTISISSKETATIVSTTTTALGTITGSCLPFISISLSFPSLFTVCCSCAIDGVGFTAALNTILLPSLIPPKIPPALFVFLRQCYYHYKNCHCLKNQKNMLLQSHFQSLHL